MTKAEKTHSYKKETAQPRVVIVGGGFGGLCAARWLARRSRQRDADRQAQLLRCLTNAMKTTRLEAFSDGVLAIIITIMVLELKVPHEVDLAALKPVLPVFLSYVLSFVYLGILLEQSSSLVPSD